jgi:threonine synthase
MSLNGKLEQMIESLRCIRCNTAYPVTEMPEGCPECLAKGTPASVVPEYDLAALDGKALLAGWPLQNPGVWRYHETLPVPLDARVSLMEGGTPLVPLDRLRDSTGVGDLLAKDERRNPTGSFKDRAMSVAVSRAKSIGAEVVTLASSGNGASAAAAYATAAGLKCAVVVARKISPSWRAAIEATGATLIAVETTAERWPLLEIAVKELGWYPLTNFIDPPTGSNWYGTEGYKSIAYEIATSLDWSVPDWVLFPVSRGDGIWGAWRGFLELQALGLIDRLPKMGAVELFPSVSSALANNLDYLPAVETTPSAASSIGGNTATYQLLKAIRDSGGTAVTCNDDELYRAQLEIGQQGIFAELSSAGGLVGTRKLVEQGLAGDSSRVVIVLTATGLTSPQDIVADLPPLVPVEPTAESLRRAIS